MTPSSAHDAAAIAGIAKGLTKAQRKAVLGPRCRWLSLRKALEWPMCGTVERMPEMPAYWQATPLGLAVRALTASTKEMNHDG